MCKQIVVYILLILNIISTYSAANPLPEANDASKRSITYNRDSNSPLFSNAYGALNPYNTPVVLVPDFLPNRQNFNPYGALNPSNLPLVAVEDLNGAYRKKVFKNPGRWKQALKLSSLKHRAQSFKEAANSCINTKLTMTSEPTRKSITLKVMCPVKCNVPPLNNCEDNSYCLNYSLSPLHNINNINEDSAFEAVYSNNRQRSSVKLFSTMSGRFTKRPNGSLSSNESASRSSSIESVEKNYRKPKTHQISRSLSPHRLSSASSDSEDRDSKSNHFSSAECLQRLFFIFSKNSRSRSCSRTSKDISVETKKSEVLGNKDLLKCSEKSTSKKSILRTPKSYVYVKGISGLPTQKVPRNSNRCSRL